MRKKFKHIVLAAILVVALAVSASAFSDVSDESLTMSTASLQSFGIINGYPDGTFRPDNLVTRAEFSTMAMAASETNTAITSPFSDVPSTHWASQAIAGAYSLGYLNGNGDGTFSPDRTITLGEATTIVLRMLGYSTADVGYSWPDDYVTKCNDLGLLDNVVETDAWTAMDRADVAQLFYNMLCASDSSGDDFVDSLGDSSLSNVVLLDVDGDVLEVMYGGDTMDYDLDFTLDSCLFMSCRGTLVLDSSGSVEGFLPNDETRVTVSIVDVTSTAIETSDGRSYYVPSSAAVIYGDNQTTFGTSYYTLEGYGYAVLCYGSNGNVSMVLPQTGGYTEGYVMNAYYEDAYPNSSQPTSITLMGAELDVDSDIAYKFASYSLGDKIRVVLDAEGNICDVSDAETGTSSVMAGILGNNSVTLLCGITVNGSITTSAEVGQMVKVSSSDVGKMAATLAVTSGSSDLDVANRMLGSYALSDSVYLYECAGKSVAKKIAISDILVDTVDGSDVIYYHLADDGTVDILLLDDVVGVCYTYGTVDLDSTTTNATTGQVTNQTISVENSEGATTPVISAWLSKYDGQPAGVAYTGSGSVAQVSVLTKTSKLARSVVSDLEYLTVDEMVFYISDDVECYNTVTETWLALDEMLAMCPTIVAYYDKSPEDGGQIRVIYGYE